MKRWIRKPTHFNTHSHTQTQRPVFLTKHGKQLAELVYRLVALACCHAKCCSACSGICSTVQTKLLDKRYSRRACGTKKHVFGSIRTHSRGSCLCTILHMSPAWRKTGTPAQHCDILSRTALRFKEATGTLCTASPFWSWTIDSCCRWGCSEGCCCRLNVGQYFQSRSS